MNILHYNWQLSNIFSKHSDWDAFLVLQLNLGVEFQGDYWHGNPKKYTKDELSKFQLEKVEKDEVLREYCKNNGIILIEIWESDYNKDISGVKQLLEESIK